MKRIIIRITIKKIRKTLVNMVKITLIKKKNNEKFEKQ